MIINDLQRLRWQILDEALRDPVMEYFMGERTKTNETGNTRSLIHHVNQRLKSFNKEWSCSKRMLQNDVNYFQQKGARLEPRFRRGHKRILRYINLEWKNPLLKPAKGIVATDTAETPVRRLPQGDLAPVSLRIVAEKEQGILNELQNPEMLQRQMDAKSGTVTVQVQLPACKSLVPLLLGFLTEVEVLSPAWLRDEMRSTISAMQKMYKKDVARKEEPAQQSLFGDLF